MPIEIIRAKPELKKKQQLIESQLSKSIKLFGQILATEKNTIGTVMDYGVDVFEELTDLIETQCKSYADKKRNIRLPNNNINANNNVKDNNTNENTQLPPASTFSLRPQQKYPFIKPAEFFHHRHLQPQIENIKLNCSNVTPSFSLSQPFVYVSSIDSL